MRHRFALPLAALAFLTVAVPAVRADDVPAETAAPAEAKGVRFLPGTPAFADVLAQSKTDGKPVFIDFTTDWCGWCRKLEKDTYSQESVGTLMQAFVNVMVDAEKGEGPEIAKRYGVSGFPTLVIVDATGGEIDRIVGYRAPDAFTTEVKRILSGEGTLPSLRAKFEASPSDVDAGLAYGARLVQSDAKGATEVFRSLADAAAKSGDRAAQARVHLETGAALLATRDREGAMTEAEAVIAQFADTPSAAKVGAKLGGAFSAADTKRALAFLDAARAAAKDPEDLAAIERVTVFVHKNAIAASLRRQAAAAGDDPQALNAVAWDCFEQKLNVREAVVWARKAVEKSGRDAAILDTLANLLWITGARDEALKTETEAETKAEGAMQREFASLVAKWTAEIEEVRAQKAAK